MDKGVHHKVLMARDIYTQCVLREVCYILHSLLHSKNAFKKVIRKPDGVE